jgi:hypothetical protein
MTGPLSEGDLAVRKIDRANTWTGTDGKVVRDLWDPLAAAEIWMKAGETFRGR